MQKKIISFDCIHCNKKINIFFSRFLKDNCCPLCKGNIIFPYDCPYESILFSHRKKSMLALNPSREKAT